MTGGFGWPWTHDYVARWCASIEADDPSDHQIPFADEDELLSDPDPEVPAGRPAQSAVVPVLDHKIEQLPGQHLSGTPPANAVEIAAVITIALLIGVVTARRLIGIIIVAG